MKAAPETKGLELLEQVFSNWNPINSLGILLIIVLGLYAIALDIRWIGSSDDVKISGRKKEKLPRGAFLCSSGEFEKLSTIFLNLQFTFNFFRLYQAIPSIISFYKIVTNANRIAAYLFYKTYNNVHKKFKEFEELVLNGRHSCRMRLTVDRDKVLGTRVNLSAVHVTLYRLEDHGFVKSKMGGATKRSGWRRKRIFTITIVGLAIPVRWTEIAYGPWNRFQIVRSVATNENKRSSKICLSVSNGFRLPALKKGIEGDLKEAFDERCSVWRHWKSQTDWLEMWSRFQAGALFFVTKFGIKLLNSMMLKIIPPYFRSSLETRHIVYKRHYLSLVLHVVLLIALFVNTVDFLILFSFKSQSHLSCICKGRLWRQSVL